MGRFLCRIGVHRWLRKRNPEVPGFEPGDSAHHTRSSGETYYECERCHERTTSPSGIGGIGIAYRHWRYRQWRWRRWRWRRWGWRRWGGGSWGGGGWGDGGGGNGGDGNGGWQWRQWRLNGDAYVRLPRQPVEVHLGVAGRGDVSRR